MDNNEAKEAIKETKPVSDGNLEIPAGVSPFDPVVKDILTKMAQTKYNLPDILETGIQSAALGIQAGEQAGSPLSAFIQGAALGMKVPTMLYQQKLAQIKDIVDATPFGITHPEIVQKGGAYELLAGLPTALALNVIKQISIDSAKVALSAQEERKTQEEKFKQEIYLKELETALKRAEGLDIDKQMEIAKAFQAFDPVQNFNSVNEAFIKIKDLYKKPLSSFTFQDDMNLAISLLQAINPKVRVNEENALSVSDSSSAISQTFKQKIRNLFLEKKVLSENERKEVLNRLKQIYSNTYDEYAKVRDVWSKKLIDRGIDPNILNPVQKENLPQSLNIATLSNGKKAIVKQLDNGKYGIIKYI
jgi:hypothetical protein